MQINKNDKWLKWAEKNIETKKYSSYDDMEAKKYHRELLVILTAFVIATLIIILFLTAIM